MALNAPCMRMPGTRFACIDLKICRVPEVLYIMVNRGGIGNGDEE
jgi:hypothetical protein